MHTVAAIMGTSCTTNRASGHARRSPRPAGRRDDARSARPPSRHRARRRPDRRRRHLRHRRRLPPAGRAARQDATRSSRPATRSAAPGTCSATPGIRSDSDLHTFGYAFKPWTRREGDRRRRRRSCAYIRETARENGIDRHIRFGHRVVARRVVERATRAGPSRSSAPTPARRVELTARLALLRQRLLPLRRGLHAASSPGLERFGGQVVHPQHWPEDLDYAGKRVVVIGSGATAVTLVPAMADDGRARDDAAALADLRPAAARARTRSPTGCARLLGDGARLRDHAAQEHLRQQRASTGSASRFPQRGARG